METKCTTAAACRLMLIIQEQGQKRHFKFEGKTRWIMGRRTDRNNPDIPLGSPIAGRVHGEFMLISDELFYCDRGSINGTFYNGKKIKMGIRKNVVPVLLKSGDVLRIDYEDLSRPDPRGVCIFVVSNEGNGEIDDSLYCEQKK